MAACWDVIAISAMDTSQKSAFEKQLATLSAISQKSSKVRVYADEPEGVKIGSGGATLSIVQRLHCEFGLQLLDFRILLIHAGGFSQRQPNASILGKLFIPTPIKNTEDNGRPFTLFELKLRSYDLLLRRMPPGIFLASSDTLEYLGDPNQLNNSILPWALDGDGFVALAHPSTLEVGRQHGVYVLDGDNPELDTSTAEVFEATCRRVLQKPGIEVMRNEGAIVKFDRNTTRELVFTDSAYYMSATIVKKLLDIYDHLSPLTCELDAYGDFLQPLGSGATDEYLREKAVNALLQNDQLVIARRHLFENFRNVPLKLLVFPKSRFYHLGTFRELIDYFCDSENDFRRDFGNEQTVFSSISAPKSETKSLSACVIVSNIGDQFVCGQTSKLMLEYCRFPSGFEFNIDEGKSILSNCFSKKPVIIPASVFMMTSTIGSAPLRYVTVVFGVEDDLKAAIKMEPLGRNGADGSGKLAVDTRKFSAVYLIDFSPNKNIFDNNFPHSLWHARMFPAFDDMGTSFDWTLKWLKAAMDGRQLDKSDMPNGDYLKFYSMRDLVAEKNIDALLSYRDTLRSDTFPNWCSWGSYDEFL